MVADALVLARETAEGKPVLDVGTGAGAPGLALALLRPDLRVTCGRTEDQARAFLRTVIGRSVGRERDGLAARGEEVLEADSARRRCRVEGDAAGGPLATLGAGLSARTVRSGSCSPKDAPPSHRVRIAARARLPLASHRRLAGGGPLPREAPAAV